MKVGAEVKVRMDAYTGEAGTHHNGRIGKVLAIDKGDVVVGYLDKPEQPVKHPATKLFVYGRRPA